MSVYRIFASMRRIIADSREYEREINRAMHQMVMDRFVQPIQVQVSEEPNRAKAKQMANLANKLEGESKGYDYSASPRKYLLAKFRSDNYLEEVLSDLYSFLIMGNGKTKPALKYIPSKILSKKTLEEIKFSDIKTLWLVMSRSIVVDTMKLITNPRHQEYFEDSMDEKLNQKLTDDIVSFEELLEEELHGLYQFITSRGKGAQTKKDSIQLLETFIKKVGLNYSGNKAFSEAFKKLPANANKRDNIRYWRNIWDSVRESMCKYFKEVFRKKGVRMTDRMKKYLCLVNDNYTSLLTTITLPWSKILARRVIPL